MRRDNTRYDNEDDACEDATADYPPIPGLHLRPGLELCNEKRQSIGGSECDDACTQPVQEVASSLQPYEVNMAEWKVWLKQPMHRGRSGVRYDNRLIKDFALLGRRRSSHT